MMFIKYAAFHLQQLGAKKQKEREAQIANNEIESKVVIQIIKMLFKKNSITSLFL